VVTIRQEIEKKSERAYMADLEKDKERLRIPGFEHIKWRANVDFAEI